MRGFRRWIRAGLVLAICPAGATWAQTPTATPTATPTPPPSPGLASVEFRITIAGTAGVDSSPSGTVTIRGDSGFESATLEIGTTPVGSLTCTSGVCSGPIVSSSAFPPNATTNFTLEIDDDDADNDPDITATIPYTPPPSPKISSPAHQAKIDPGPAEVTFAAFTDCTATTPVCSTHGRLTQGGVSDPLADQDVLPIASSSWKPTNASGAVDFPPEADLSVTIEHRGDRSSSLFADGPGSGTTDDEFTFQNVSVHSDTVSFSTGSAPPSGDFCIVVNDGGALPLACTAGAAVTLVDAPAAGILDGSDSDPTTPELDPYATTAAGIPIEYGLQLAPSGRLSGIGGANLDGDASFETPADLVGRLKGKEGLLRQRLRLRFDGGALDTRFKVRLREQAQLSTIQGTGADDLDWLAEQKTSGKANGTKLSERTTGTRTTTAALSGWKLEFTLAGSEGPIAGNLTLASGVSVALTGTHGFDSSANLSDLKLRSEGAERGVQIRIKKLAIGTSMDPQDVTAGSLRFRAFGQRGSALLQ
jgi:hypothetical protein